MGKFLQGPGLVRVSASESESESTNAALSAFKSRAGGFTRLASGLLLLQLLVQLT